MWLIGLGALLMVAGVVVASVTTARRGRLSQAEQPITHEERDTLEPTGRGRRLSLRSDLPGIGLALLGALLMFIGAMIGW